MTVAAYSEEWLDSVKLAVRPSTFGFYSSLARLHLTDLRHLPIDTVTSRDVRRLISTRVAEGYSARTVRGVVDVLRMILKQAQVDGLVSRNVAELVTLPPLNQAEPAHLTADEARRFLAAARTDELYPLFAVALGTGLRVGELTALTWQDVDGYETVRIRRAKTKAGERIVPLPAFAADALREMERRPGRIWPVDRWVPGKRMAGICRRAGVPKIGMHGLRHSTASLLYAEGVPEFVIQSILGHTKIGMTRHYTHIEIEQQRDAMAKLGRVVG